MLVRNNLTPLGIDRKYTHMTKHVTARWARLMQVKYARPNTRRALIDVWLDSCETALQNTHSQFFDEDGKPLD